MRLAAVAIVALLAGCLGGDPASGSELEPAGEPARVSRTWGDPAQAIVRPGAWVGSSGLANFLPQGSSCTANFLFTDAAATRLFVGTAAHCFGSDDGLGTAQDIGEGEAVVWTRLVYSSWLASGKTHEEILAACDDDPLVGLSDDPLCWNDFALLEVDPADWARAHPAALGIPGPTGQAAAVVPGTLVTTYGSSPARAVIGEPTHVRSGPVLDVTSQRLVVHTGIPSTAGDSGGPVVTMEGEAVGVVVYLLAVPPTGTGVAALPFLLEQAAAAGWAVDLVPWP